MASSTTGWEAALWGLLGGGVAEALNLGVSMRPSGPRRRWRWPWSSPADRPMVLVAIALRLFVGVSPHRSGHLPSAFLAGLTAPLVVARLFQMMPVIGPAPARSGEGAEEGFHAPERDAEVSDVAR